MSFFSMLIQHHDLDDLETDILDLNNLLKEKEFKEYKRTCEAGIIELDHIYNSEIPSVGECVLNLRKEYRAYIHFIL